MQPGSLINNTFECWLNKKDIGEYCAYRCNEMNFNDVLRSDWKNKTEFKTKLKIVTIFRFQIRSNFTALEAATSPCQLIDF